MKHHLIVLSFLLLPPILPVRAEEAEVFDYEGYPTIIHSESSDIQNWRPKFWNLHIDTKDGSYINMDYRLAGETQKQGKYYVRVVLGYEQEVDLLKNDFLLMTAIRPYGETYADTLYYRQEGDKVYILREEDGQDILVIDYGLKTGEEFTDGNGEVFIVEESDKQNNNRHICGFYYYSPRRLKLKSKLTGEENIWIEGLGSVYWGITPYFLMAKTKVFRQQGLQPSHAQVLMGYGGNLLLEPNVNTRNYKAEMIDIRCYEEENDIRNIEYKFIGDTLCVWGMTESEHYSGYAYAECLIDDNLVNVMIKSFSETDEKREGLFTFWAQIPGFKKGTYKVGIPGQEYVTLECSGTDGIVSPKASGSSSVLYDLSGRCTTRPIKGVYIRQGRKVVK